MSCKSIIVILLGMGLPPDVFDGMPIMAHQERLVSLPRGVTDRNGLHPAELRQGIVNLARAGWTVASFARESESTEKTLRN